MGSQKIERLPQKSSPDNQQIVKPMPMKLRIISKDKTTFVSVHEDNLINVQAKPKTNCPDSAKILKPKPTDSHTALASSNLTCSNLPLEHVGSQQIKRLCSNPSPTNNELVKPMPMKTKLTMFEEPMEIECVKMPPPKQLSRNDGTPRRILAYKQEHTAMD